MNVTDEPDGLNGWLKKVCKDKELVKFLLYIYCLKNNQFPPENMKTDNITKNRPRAGGATMSRAHNGHLIFNKAQYRNMKTILV